MELTEKKYDKLNRLIATYSDKDKIDAFAHIIEELYKGRALHDIIDNNKTNIQLPTAYTFFKWLANDPHLTTVYHYAREVKAHRIFDECLAIADNIEGNNDDMAQIQRDRLRLDARKFYLAKVLPKVYGDKVDVTSNGESITVLSLGAGIAPPESSTVDYIDVTGNDEASNHYHNNYVSPT